MLLEVSFEFLTRLVEQFALFSRVGREECTGCPRGHRTCEPDRVIHITMARRQQLVSTKQRRTQREKGKEGVLTTGTMQGVH